MRDDFPPHPVFKIPATADDPPQPQAAPGFGLVQPAEPVRTGRIVAAGAVGALVLGVIFAVSAPKGFPGAPDTRPAAKAQAAADASNFRPIAGRYAPPDRERILAAYREAAKVSASDGIGAVARASMDCFEKLARQADYGLMDFCLALDAFGAETYAREAGEAAPPSTYFGQGPVRRQQAVQRLTAGQTDANSRLLDTYRLIREVARSAPDVTPPPPPPPTVVMAEAEPPPAPLARPTAPVSAKLLAPTPLAEMPPPAPSTARPVQVAKVEPKPAVAAPTVITVFNKPAPAAQPRPAAPAKPAVVAVFAPKPVLVAKAEPKPAVSAVFNKPAPAAQPRPAVPARPAVVAVLAPKTVQARSAPARQIALAKPAQLASKPVKLAKAPPPQPAKARLAKAAKAPPAPIKPAPKLMLAKAEPKGAHPTPPLRAPWIRQAKAKPAAAILAPRPAPAAPLVKAPPTIKSASAAKPAPIRIAKAEPAAPTPAPAPDARAKPPVAAERAPSPEPKAEAKAEPKAEVREAKHEEPAGCRGRTRGERMVCQEPSLAAADKRLSAAFSQALDQTPNPRALVAEQNRWLARRDALAPDAGAVMTAYQDRIAELNHRGR